MSTSPQDTVLSLKDAADSAYATADSVWNAMETECQDQATAALGGKDEYVTRLTSSMPFVVDQVDDDNGEVHSTDAQGEAQVQRFTLHDGEWRLTCDGIQFENEADVDTLDSATSGEAPAADGGSDDAYDAHLAYSCPPEGNALYQPGTALYEDGTTGYEADCDVPGGYNPYGPQSRSNDGTADSYIGDDGLQHWNGEGSYEDWVNQRSDRPGGTWGRVGAERCGTACGDSPTSGEIQTKHGCEQGYIDDPEICDSIDW